ncbi:MAG: phospho-N-acetylmuramoyl-pentapeptide-transferase [Firmicutes bacterium]|nr:phospho-N-acetylmuramoyl-pentapeptide-transferase [Bacillota bacterium]
MLITALIGFVIAFLVGVIFAPIVLYFARRLKAGQPILHYVEMHSAKSGTPTMGGILFITTIFSVGLMSFNGSSTFAVVTLAAMVAFGVIGFLDDFIKIKYKQNLGLRAYQKIIGQGGVALILSWFAYTNTNIGTEILLPFTATTVDIGLFIIPLVFIVIIAVTNSVNLTDGLDGLATSTAIAFISVFAVIVFIISTTLVNPILIENYNNIIILCAISVGALLAFLTINCYKAKIFMGDTGSLALGALIACICIFTRLTLILPFIGIMFVVSSLSVILQVTYFKLTKGKRIFLMAPFHHHLEKKGYNESRVVNLYSTVTFIVGAVIIILYLI